MKLSNKMGSLSRLFRPQLIVLFIILFDSCIDQATADTDNSIDISKISEKVAPESLHFSAHVRGSGVDGSKIEIDTITGYRKYYYNNGKLQMEGKAGKGDSKDYRMGIWKYYNENGQLMTQESYIKEGKVDQLDIMYLINGNPLMETYQYYEGDYKDKKRFKHHKIERIFYDDGQKRSERHWVNDKMVGEKSWSNTEK